MLNSMSIPRYDSCWILVCHMLTFNEIMNLSRWSRKFRSFSQNPSCHYFAELVVTKTLSSFFAIPTKPIPTNPALIPHVGLELDDLSEFNLDDLENKPILHRLPLHLVKSILTTAKYERNIPLIRYLLALSTSIHSFTLQGNLLHGPDDPYRVKAPKLTHLHLNIGVGNYGAQLRPFQDCPVTYLVLRTVQFSDYRVSKIRCLRTNRFTDDTYDNLQGLIDVLKTLSHLRVLSIHDDTSKPLLSDVFMGLRNKIEYVYPPFDPRQTMTRIHEQLPGIKTVSYCTI